MPARTGPSSCSTVLPILPRPSARSVPRCRRLWPISLRTCVIRTFVILHLLRLRRRTLLRSRFLFLVGGSSIWKYLLHGQPADLGELEHGADAAAGDDAGPLARRTEQHARRVESAEHLVRERRPVLRDLEEVLLRVLDRLRNRQRHLARLPVADADAVDLVADDDERREREPPAALHDLGDAVDLDHPLLELARLLAGDHFTFD